MRKLEGLPSVTLFVLLLGVPSARADSDFAFRLVKTPDASDSSKPATLAYQHDDGGKSDYVTEGAVKVDKDFGPGNRYTFSPSVSWNHNTLASTVTDNWSYTAGLVHQVPVGQESNLTFSGSVGEQRDATKSSNATVVKLGASWIGWPRWKREGTTDFAELVPTLTAFTTHVSQAKADATTGIVPVGTMNGGLLALNGQAQLGRWTLNACAQYLRTTDVVNGDKKGGHHLDTVFVGYQFVDPPRTKQELAAASWVPGIALSRQSGDDPLNAIANSKYTQLALTLKY